MARKFVIFKAVSTLGRLVAPKQGAAAPKADDRQPVGDPAERPLWLNPPRRTVEQWLRFWKLLGAEAPAPGDLAEALRKPQSPREQRVSEGLSRGRSPISKAPAQHVAPGIPAPPSLSDAIIQSRKQKGK